MKRLMSATLLLSLLFAANNLMAFKIQKLEKPEFAMPRGVIGKHRSDFAYKETHESICYGENDNEKWSEFENELKAELKKAGIFEGAAVWSKGHQNKYRDLPGLTKVTIKKIDLLIEVYVQKKTGKKGCDNIYTMITAEVDGKQKILQFGDYEYEEDRAYDVIRSFHTKNPAAKWSKKVVAAIKEGKVILGMTKAQATESWGEPEDVNRTVGSWGTKEQWVYGSRSYLYFTNDKLDSFQN